MKKRMKYSALFIIPIFIAMFTMTVHLVHAEEKSNNDLQFASEANSAILIERDTGEVIYEKNSAERLAPASLTKIMTLLLVMESIEEGKLDLKELVTVSRNAASMGGSQVFLAEGEQMTVDDLIKAVAIASANDASVALAERLAGSEQAFVKRMNEKVKELNLKNTQFQNASGLPAKDHYTSAYDIAIIARELLKFDNITNYTNIYEDYLRKGKKNEFWLVNTNKLVHFYPYVDGLKTGYTSDAKYCLVATAQKDNMRLISIVMGAETSKERNKMTMEMIDFGLSNYELDKLYDKNEKVASLKLLKAKKYNNDVQTTAPISVLKEKGKEQFSYETEIKLDEHISLPLKKGAKVGVIDVKQNDETINSYPIVVEENIELANIFTLMKRTLKNIAKNE